MLRQAVEERCLAERYPKEMETLTALMEQRERELRAAALTIGARFYAEKPSTFCSRLGAYWHSWRREKNPSRVLVGPAS